MKRATRFFSWLGTSLLMAFLFIYWLTAASCVHAENSTEVTDAEQAFALAKSRTDVGSLRDHEVFIADQPFAGGSDIPSWGKSIEVPRQYDRAWFLFVDDQPEANWEHACRYFFIDAETGQITVISATTPPDNWLEMKKIHSSEKKP